MQTTKTPFHSGELAIQEMLGVREMVGSYAPRVIRPLMPNQHREFYTSLPYFFMGSLDADGLPWASMLWGAPGFVSSPDAATLAFNMVPGDSDPLRANLIEGHEVGMVGVQFHTRRRNRVNGRVDTITENSFSIKVTQSFGNCPQYIQGREITALVKRENVSHVGTISDTLSHEDKAMISAADTLFIASASGLLGSDVRHGVDMSHRGGTPGFVKILDDGSLLIPDFSGNNHFNTLGNIHVNPVAGLVFFDFTSGDVLQLSGSAEIVWPNESRFHYEGALRYVRITPTKVVRRNSSMPYVWNTPDMSPFLPVAEWKAMAERKAAPAASQQEYVIADIIAEADSIKSFYLTSLDGAPTPGFEAGQHLPIAVTPNGTEERRTYTLSAAPGKAMLRLTIKRDARGTVSRFMHDSASVGDTLKACRPGGGFTLQEQRDRPVVLLSAGVGITPMIAMAETLLAEAGKAPEIHFIHGSRTLAETAFLADLRRLRLDHSRFNLSLRFSEASAPDLEGIPAASRGKVSPGWLSAYNLPLDGDFYLCGPGGFMQATYDWLAENGVPEDRIFFEAFGPSSLKRKTAEPKKTYPLQPVKFSHSGIETKWDANKESLLEMAENKGIEAPSSCRSGSCGSCMVPLLKGRAAYETPPAYPVPDDNILLCCAVPADPKDNEETRQPLVIDL